MTQQQTLYAHPFSKAYWKQAAGEVRNTRMLVFAALMIALRVLFKPLSIPIAADLRINTAFIVNALGSMCMGPVLAALCAAVTDTLGCLLFPTGPYFFPFIFLEIAGSVIFALFLYRTQISAAKVIAARFCICFFVNILLQTPIMVLYYQMVMGRYYAPFDLLRIGKNLALFPLESAVLMVILRHMVPVLGRMGFVTGEVSDLRMRKRTAVVLAALVLLGAAAVGGYAWEKYNGTSLSASYTAGERYDRNRALEAEVLAAHPEVDPETAVCVIESAYPRAFHPEVTYTVAVYRAELPAEGGEDLLRELRGLSKSPAAKREELTLLFRETLVRTEAELRKEAAP